MNKKKILLSVAATSMIAVTGAVVINGGLNSSSVFATDGVVWHHYAAVAPTETTHGSKEFWASSADGCATHQFTNPGVTCIEHNDFSTYESFASLTYDDDRYVMSDFEERNAVYPIFTGQNVYYGLYPQNNVSDTDLITSLDALEAPESNGWYLYDGEYYAKLNETNWFKCEPITWDVLSNSNGEYSILSSVLLDAHRYDNDSNNYKDSEIRSFLNKDFYNSAFALGNSYIKTTTVDNNIQDRVFLLSQNDYISRFPEKESRYCKTTGWARARGAYYSYQESYLNNGYYWTRTPHSDKSDYAITETPTGTLYYSVPVTHTDKSVRPAITIKIA